jgi:hypothetical protein
MYKTLLGSEGFRKVSFRMSVPNTDYVIKISTSIKSAHLWEVSYTISPHFRAWIFILRGMMGKL